LVVLVTKAGGACGNVCEGADFLWSVWRRRGTGDGNSDTFFFPAGFAFLCSFKVGRGVLFRFFIFFILLLC